MSTVQENQVPASAIVAPSWWRGDPAKYKPDFKKSGPPKAAPKAKIAPKTIISPKDLIASVVKPPAKEIRINFNPECIERNGNGFHFKASKITTTMTPPGNVVPVEFSVSDFSKVAANLGSFAVFESLATTNPKYVHILEHICALALYFPIFADSSVALSVKLKYLVSIIYVCDRKVVPMLKLASYLWWELVMLVDEDLRKLILIVLTDTKCPKELLLTEAGTVMEKKRAQKPKSKPKTKTLKPLKAAESPILDLRPCPDPSSDVVVTE